LEAASYLWWIPLLPLIGAGICGALHLATLRARKSNPDAKGPAGFAPLVASAAMGGALIFSIIGFLAICPCEDNVVDGEQIVALQSSTWSWISVADLRFDLTMWLDRLSSIMTLVVTGVGLLIHIYSAGYMKGDKGYAKFFAYLNLFCFAMLMLVLSSNLLGLFIGWEGVGLCSYLLIGFWYEKGWPAEAGQKAFVVNRIGDAFFIIGSFILIGVFGTLEMQDIGAQVPAMIDAHSGKLALAALLLFGGACGKSAQLPLFVWLPDAMAGPTPVSALIHAATMVTSGVYMIVRLNPLYAASPGVLMFIGCVAAATAFIAGTTALVQRDLKKVLAYSTVSQLGYMFLGIAAGAWGAAIFHLVTHAFFKALLFLGAGSVIHGMHEEQDMHKMGGLRKHMPRTYATFLAGAAALSGLPLMSGFFSKDEILAKNFAMGGVNYLFWMAGVVTAAITAYYTWRMVALTFFGEERFDAKKVHPHESPALMTGPLFVLAVLSIIGGAVLGLPHVFHLWNHALDVWLEPVVLGGNEILSAQKGMHMPLHLTAVREWILLALGSAVALFFAHKGFHDHKRGLAMDESVQGAFPVAHAKLTDAWGIDSGYARVIVQPVKLLAFVIAVIVDQFAIDGAVNGAGRMASDFGRRGRRLVDGSVSCYGLWIGAAAVVLALTWFWRGN